MNTKNSPPKFVFIIPTLTNREGLKDVSKNIEKVYPEVKTIIINNNSESITLDNSSVVAVNMGRNTGFAKASNFGAKKAESLFHPKYFVFLNDDVWFDDDWVGKCVDAIENNKWIAATPILMKDKNNVENYGYRVLPHGKVELMDNGNKQLIDGLSAAALVFDAEKFLELGGFDESFFAYLEDVDLFLRAKRKGHNFGVVQNARVFHEGQKTSSKFETRRRWLNFKNWIRIINKNWSKEDLKKYWPQISVERLRNLWGVVKSLF